MNKELKKEIYDYKIFYQKKDWKINFFHKIVNHPDIVIQKSIICAKKYQYYKNNRNKIINKLKMIYYGRKNNMYVNKYNLELYGRFGKRMKIYHNNIIINSNASLGDNVILHGNNCIGNNGITEECPQIGNNVDIGYGSIIIGNIIVADNIKIGANSVVTKSFKEKGITIAGVPARKINKEENNGKE